MSVLGQLTLAEVEMIEKLGKASITSLGDENKPKGAIFAAIAYVVQRKTDQGFTLEQAREMTMEQVNNLMGVSGDGDGELDPLEISQTGNGSSTDD
jgi:hypothetical protein